ncbi:DUF2145 domain-containing protein [Ideonella sp.]|uniref:DUF2145 domain-containing protein n=1 Tax=Ideonella sp. TaxID=1929293 RepID=UPI0035B1AF83
MAGPILAPARHGLAALLLAGMAAAAPAGTLRYCDRGSAMTAAQQDQALQLAARLKQELDAAGEPVALVSRSGLNLAWLGLRFTHAGLALRDSPRGPWAVRQLYFDCDAAVPRLFDQGMAGFVLGTDDRQARHVSVVFLPPAASAPLARLAGSAPGALAVLAADYSANAYAWGLRYQNCNQWVAELLGLAWGELPLQPPPGAHASAPPLRRQAQDWLRRAGYAPMVFDVFPPLRLAAAAVPWLHEDDHPGEDRARSQYRVSMPDALEAFVRRRWPEARRVEVCHAGDRLVVRRGWDPIADGCMPAPGDELRSLGGETAGTQAGTPAGDAS